MKMDMYNVYSFVCKKYFVYIIECNYDINNNNNNSNIIIACMSSYHIILNY